MKRQYMYEHTKMPSYLPMPRFLLNCSISNTAKLLYIQLLGKAQLSQRNRWLDGQGRVYFIYPIHQMSVDMEKSKPMIITTNLTIKEMDETQDLNEARIYDRIRAVCQPVQVKGESQRRASRSQMMEKFRGFFQCRTKRREFG